ncbi:MAG: beta-N-acetylhexosaminidase [Thermoguttaceae bacterium]|jgi:hexosaminidase
MNSSRFAALAVAGILFAAAGRFAAADPGAPLALVPQPLHVERGAGQFLLKADTAIVVDQDSAETASAGKLLAQRLARSTGLELKVSTSPGALAPPGAIRIMAGDADVALGREGYRLEVKPEGVLITAHGVAGMFYGTQTFLQLLPPQVFSPTRVADGVAWAAPAVQITDRPRFPWRGLLLDVARHFFQKEELKNFLDLMAEHKLNTLHLHLTDDQGWRIQIKRYPKLTEVAAWRKAIDFGFNPKDGTAYGKDGRYGGFYSQDDIRELVAYARARAITIVPEIEMPGHAAAALSAYPEFSCFGGPYDRDSGRMGIYCPGNDAAFTFLQDVLTEVIGLFPGKYIHIGGDEVDKGNWTRCPKCQARIKQEGLKNEHELQSYFVKRIERFINARGRTLIGWDEILEGGLAPNATVMSWRDVASGVTAANAGHDVVMTPTSHCYFDYCQGKSGEPRAIGGFLPLATVYGFEPLPPELAAAKARHILGTGGNLWSEFFPNYAQVQYMAYPRACAIAEVGWTDRPQKNWADFKRRCQTHFQRLTIQGVHYRPPKPADPGY